MTCKQEVATGGVETRPQKPERPGTVLSFYPSAVSSSSSAFESCDILWSDISSGEDPSFKNEDPQDIFFFFVTTRFLGSQIEFVDKHTRIISWRQACRFTSTNIRWAASRTTTTREEESLERERERRGPGVFGRSGFNFRSLVQAFPFDGLHGQWTEIHAKSGKKLVHLCSLHTSHTAQAQALFYLMLIKC